MKPIVAAQRVTAPYDVTHNVIIVSSLSKQKQLRLDKMRIMLNTTPTLLGGGIIIVMQDHSPREMDEKSVGGNIHGTPVSSLWLDNHNQ